MCVFPQIVAGAGERSRRQAGEEEQRPAGPLLLLRPGRPGRRLAGAGQPRVQADG